MGRFKTIQRLAKGWSITQDQEDQVPHLYATRFKDGKPMTSVKFYPGHDRNIYCENPNIVPDHIAQIIVCDLTGNSALGENYKKFLKVPETEENNG